MDASKLEALRLQALQSLKNSKPMSPPVFGSADGSSDQSQMKQSQSKRSKSAHSGNGAKSGGKIKKKKKNKPKNRPNHSAWTYSNVEIEDDRDILKPWMVTDQVDTVYETEEVSPSTQLFNEFTSKLFDQSLTTEVNSLKSEMMPPAPGSFNMPTKPLQIRSAIVKGPIVFDLDAYSDGEERPSKILPITSLLSEPGEIAPCPVKDDELRRAVEAEISNLKSLIDNLDATSRRNEKAIADAQAKQSELRARIKEYKSIIDNVRAMQEELAGKKTRLFNRLIKARQRAESFGISTEPTAVSDDASSKPLSSFPESAVQSPLITAESQSLTPLHESILVQSNSTTKRKNEMMELEKQLDRVQKELEVSRMNVLKSKKMKKARKSSAKEWIANKKLIPASDELVEVDGNLVPVSLLSNLWCFLKQIKPAQVLSSAESASECSALQIENYESPLKWFKSSKFFSHFVDFCSKKGILSSTYTNKIDPLLPFCKEEFGFGCTDKQCIFQHFHQIQPSDHWILENIIQRLLEFSPKEKFKTKADVLLYIQEKLSTTDLKGVPIVSLVSKLVELRKDISAEDTSIKPLSNGETVSSLSFKANDSLCLKQFLKSISEPRRKCLLVDTDALVSGSYRGPSRYYIDGNVESSDTDVYSFLREIAQNVHSEEAKGQILAKLADLPSHDTRARIILSDVALALSIDAPMTTTCDRAYLWHQFLCNNDFLSRSKIATSLLTSATDSDEFFHIVMGIAKSAVDESRKDETKALFLAALQSQMSLSHEDVLPCAQLCAPSVEVSSSHKLLLWLFYCEVIQTGTYSSHWFLSYPYDSCANTSFRPILQWKNCGKLLDEFSVVLECFLEDTQVGSLAAYNMLSLRLALGQPLSDAVTGLEQIPDFVIQSLVEADIAPFSDILSQLVHAMSLWNAGCQKLAAEALSMMDHSNSLNSSELEGFAALFSRATQPAADWLRGRTSMLGRLGRALYLENPLSPLLTVDFPIYRLFTELELEMHPALIRTTEDLMDLTMLLQAIQLDPADSLLWKSLLSKIQNAPSLMKYQQQCVDRAICFFPSIDVGVSPSECRTSP